MDEERSSDLDIPKVSGGVPASAWKKTNPRGEEWSHLIYTPQNKHGTWKWTLGKGDSYWKPPFPGSMLIFGGVTILEEIYTLPKFNSKSPWKVAVSPNRKDSSEKPAIFQGRAVKLRGCRVSLQFQFQDSKSFWRATSIPYIPPIWNKRVARSEKLGQAPMWLCAYPQNLKAGLLRH